MGVGRGHLLTAWMWLKCMLSRFVVDWRGTAQRPSRSASPVNRHWSRPPSSRIEYSPEGKGSS